MSPVTETPPRFVNKRPQRRYLKIAIGVFVALLVLVGLAFAALLYRAPVVVLPSPTPLPPLPSVDFSGQPALIVEYGNATATNASPSSSSTVGQELDDLAPMTTRLNQPSPLASPTPQSSASSQSPVAVPSLVTPQLTNATPQKPQKLQKPQNLTRPSEPQRKSPNKVALPTLPPADFSVLDPGSRPNIQPSMQSQAPLDAFDTGEGKYVLVGGSFATRPQAEAALLALKSKGLSAKIIQENKRYRLQSLQPFQGPDAAMQAADQLAQHGLDVVIRKLK